MNKPKKLTLGNLQADSNRHFKKIEKTIQSASGTDYTVVFKNNIKDTEIAEIMSDITQKVHYCNENKIPYNYLTSFMYGILNCCVELPKTNKTDLLSQIAFEEKLLTELIDMGIYEAIFEEIGEKRINYITDTIFNDANKDLLELLNDKQVANMLLYNDVIGDIDIEEI